MAQNIDRILHELAVLLIRNNVRVVFAESCTGGLISATLSRVPGISAVHCGSAVVYRLDTKTRWLGVPASLLIDPGPVSEPVARAMVEGVLSRTPEATLGVAITGHLGPNAPSHQDGQIFVGVAARDKPGQVFERRLPKFDMEIGETGRCDLPEREQRQWAAVEFVFRQMVEVIQTDFGVTD